MEEDDLLSLSRVGLSCCLGGFGVGELGACETLRYLWLFAEAQPGESHELSFAVGEGVLGVGEGSHAG